MGGEVGSEAPEVEGWERPWGREGVEHTKVKVLTSGASRVSSLIIRSPPHLNFWTESNRTTTLSDGSSETPLPKCMYMYERERGLRCSL